MRSRTQPRIAANRTTTHSYVGAGAPVLFLKRSIEQEETEETEKRRVIPLGFNGEIQRNHSFAISHNNPAISPNYSMAFAVLRSLCFLLFKIIIRRYTPYVAKTDGLTKLRYC